MKPDYKNWIPRGLLFTMFGGVALLFLLAVLIVWVPLSMTTTIRTVLAGILIAASILLAVASCWMLFLYRAFSYTGKRQIVRRIINCVADETAATGQVHQCRAAVQVTNGDFKHFFLMTGFGDPVQSDTSTSGKMKRS